MVGKRRKIGALIFPGFELLDLFGPLEMFGLLPEQFEMELIADTTGAVVSGQTLAAHATRDLNATLDFDILFVPGGRGTRSEVNNTKLLDWIGKASNHAEFTLSVCTGSALLARSGVLDGHQATTNKLAFDWVTQQGPKVDWVPKARWVEDGRFITSSGVSAGMDMALGAIALMHGEATAEKVAGWGEYIWNKDRHDDPFAS